MTICDRFKCKRDDLPAGLDTYVSSSDGGSIDRRSSEAQNEGQVEILSFVSREGGDQFERRMDPADLETTYTSGSDGSTIDRRTLVSLNGGIPLKTTEGQVDLQGFTSGGGSSDIFSRSIPLGMQLTNKPVSIEGDFATRAASAEQEEQEDLTRRVNVQDMKFTPVSVNGNFASGGGGGEAGF